MAPRQCDFGCGRPSTLTLKSGRPCCEGLPQKCPGFKQRALETKKAGAGPRWAGEIPLKCSCGAEFSKTEAQIRGAEAQGKTLQCKLCTASRAGKKKWLERDPREKASTIEAARQGVLRFLGKLTGEQRRERSRVAGSGNTALSVLKQWASIKNDPARLAALAEKRGVTSRAVWDSKTPEQKRAWISKALRNGGRSRVCDEFLDALETRGLKLDREHVVGSYLVDGVEEGTKLAVEFYGNLWHCPPGTYADDLFCPWVGKTAAAQRARDEVRMKRIEALGYRTLVVWESDWRKAPEETLERVLRFRDEAIP